MRNREVKKIVCSCGGDVKEEEPSDTEEKRYGCQQRGCCVTAFQCQLCKTRFTFALCSPETM